MEKVDECKHWYKEMDCGEPTMLRCVYCEHTNIASIIASETEASSAMQWKIRLIVRDEMAKQKDGLLLMIKAAVQDAFSKAIEGMRRP